MGLTALGGQIKGMMNAARRELIRGAVKYF
jgi:hypothetical protein